MPDSPSKNITQLSGVVDKILYENNTFTIASLTKVVDDTNEPIPAQYLSKYGTVSIKGNFLTNQDEVICAKGVFIEDAKYGYQFNVSKLVVDTVSEAGLALFFATHKFKGLGDKKAAKLATLLTEINPKNPLRALLDLDVETLEKELKLSVDHITAIKDVVEDDLTKETTLLELSEYIKQQSLREKLYEEYKSSATSILLSNPYEPITTISGYGFRIADTVAFQLGFAPNNTHRLQALVQFCINECSNRTGDTIVDETHLLKEMMSIGGSCTLDEYKTSIKDAVTAKKIVTIDYNNQPHYQSFSLNQAELGITVQLHRLLKESGAGEFSDEKIQKAIETSQMRNNITYDQSQIDAIKTATKYDVSVVTGGPGTGKTTTVNGLIDVICDLNHFKQTQVKRIAPTGRAASRMGHNAMTIHSFLGISPDYTPKNLPKLDDVGSIWYEDRVKVVIIDEFSMVDSTIANLLLSVIPTGTHLVIVGDVDQLPSVAPGQVLADLIHSGEVPTTRLQYIHRQGENSSISELAAFVKDGKFPERFYQNTNQTRFVFYNTNYTAPTLTASIIQNALNYTDFKTDDIQTITPMNKGESGIVNMNNIIRLVQNPMQQLLDGVQKEIKIGSQTFAVGDRVMNTKNCLMTKEGTAEKINNLITNGDIGTIVDIVTEDDNKQNHYISIAINGETYYFYREMWNQLTLAYAITVHKSQGGEFPLVILNLANTNPHMLSRNLLYTAITRASDMLVIIGTPELIEKTLLKKDTSRKTYLQQILTQKNH